MSDFESFFTDEAIIRILCKQRMAFCLDAHRRNFFEKLSPSKQIGKSLSILSLMPPRSRWKRVSKQANNSHLQNTNNLKFTVKQLREASAPEDHSWISAQDKLVESIRIKALARDGMRFEPPKIKPIPKDKSKSEYRLIASYSENLEDSIIIGQCANYLRRKFDDEYFLDCSFAFRFRSPPNGNNPVTHHNAFEELARFWKENQKDNQIQAYIAECDIQGFYDTIDHEIILSCYDAAVLELKEKQGIDIDDRAKQAIIAYLESYTYNNYGRPEALFILKKNSALTKVKDRDETLDDFLYPGIKYGVPQGGALSVFFANLILHKADLAVMEILEAQGSDAVYVRYCDDMVIATLDEGITDRAFEAYIDEIDKLKLKHHYPEPIVAYSGTKKRDFWNTKTKKTYLWGNKANVPSAMPWLGFVGYHLRYDGMVRIRPSSIQKELEKQRKIRKKFIESIETAIKDGKTLSSKRKLLASLEGRLRAGAIGRRPDLDLSCGLTESEFGWCVGFNKLASKHLPGVQPFAKSQLRCLDRGLGKQLAIAKTNLAKHPELLNYGGNSEKPKPQLKFSGKPRSYAGQLKPESSKSN
jgi:hypothetical protein